MADADTTTPEKAALRDGDERSRSSAWRVLSPSSGTGSRFGAVVRDRPTSRNPRLGAHDDSLRIVRPLLIATRWGTLAVGIAVAATAHTGQRPVIAGAVLAAYALYRTFRPLRCRRSRPLDLAAVLGEVALTMTVVVATGYWSSPYLFCLATAVVAAGFARGFSFATVAAGTAAVAIAITAHLRTPDGGLRPMVLGTAELLLIAYVTGYARRVFGEAEARTSQALVRLQRLSDANDLLQELHQVTQTLPATLDLKETVRSTVEGLRAVVEADVVSVLLVESAQPGWVVAVSDGVRLGDVLTEAAAPHALRAAYREGRSVLVDDYTESTEQGLSPSSKSALYVPLQARGAAIGLLAMETRQPGGLGERDVVLVESLAEQAALAIDNARWFAKLRTVGADEERTRIARDLHDRVGQSLAYLAFELDRLTRQAEGSPIHTDLANLRQDVRRVVSEVRDTLYDLRTDVSETQDLAATLEAFLDRVRTRSGLQVTLRSAASRRPPLRQERELWRIAQEAVTNVERHAQGSSITVTWRCDERGAELEIDDDGIGFERHRDGRADSYGIVGMHERADSIGARLDIHSEPGRGTRVRCFLASTEVIYA